jgi:hypothetical protein
MTTPLTGFPPTAFESTDDGRESGNHVFEKALSVRGVLSVKRDAHVEGSLVVNDMILADSIGANRVDADGGVSFASGAVDAHAVSLTELSAPGVPTVTPETVGGGKTWTYRVVALLANGLFTEAGPAGSTADGEADLSVAANGNTISWMAIPDAASYNVYRTVCGQASLPATTGKITATPITATSLLDDGLAGDATIEPALNGTGGVYAPRGFLYGSHGELVHYGSTTELLTMAAAATSTTVGDLLPENSVIIAVVGRVTVIIPTAATFKVGDGTTDDRFATGILVAAGTTFVGLSHYNVAAPGGQAQPTAAKIVITPNAPPNAATGRLRLTVFYAQFIAPDA